MNVSMRMPSGSSAVSSRNVPVRSPPTMPQVVSTGLTATALKIPSSRLLAELPLLSVGPRCQRTLTSDELSFGAADCSDMLSRHTTTLYQFLGILVQQHCECIIFFMVF